MSEPTVEERRVEPGEWVGAVRAARDEGYGFFDWLSAVDESDSTDEHGPGTTPDCRAQMRGRTTTTFDTAPSARGSGPLRGAW